MPTPVDPHTLVIFGASGDLAERKLIPSVFRLYQGGYLPDDFVLLGLGRTEYSDQAFREKVVHANEQLLDDVRDEATQRAFAEHLHYTAIATYTDEADFVKIRERLQALQSHKNYIFYLSVPPSLYESIPAALARQGLNDQAEGWSRLIIEKPFGYDTASARELNEVLLRDFEEDQIYRIDHYLGKETVQNLLVTRFANGIFEPLWNRNYIHSIQITAAETVGVGSRGGYYDTSGALRDMVQNHLLQVLAHVAMEPPISSGARAIRNEKLKLFQTLQPFDLDEIQRYVVRGQYTHSDIGGEHQIGYREAEGVPDNSRTETYVAIKFFIDNWRWSGVPFYVRTGKHLPTKVTEVVVTFKRPPQRIFHDMSDAVECSNRLILRIQPNEGLELQFAMKVPGEGFQVKTVDMDFLYADLTDAYVPEAYERLLLDCMKGDPTLYSRGDSVEAAWAFVDPILEAWEQRPELTLYGYPAGTWGPEAADQLFMPEGGSWHNPAPTRTEVREFQEL